MQLVDRMKTDTRVHNQKFLVGEGADPDAIYISLKNCVIESRKL